MNNKNINQHTSTPSLMGNSAKNINAEVAKSGMLARLEDPTGQKKSKSQKNAFGIIPTKISRVTLISLITAIAATVILYFSVRKVTQEDETHSPIVTYSNDSPQAVGVNKPVSDAKQTITANESVVLADSEVTSSESTLSPAATIVTEPEADLNSKKIESTSVVENPHEQLSKALMGDSTPASSTNSIKSAEEADASRKLASTLAKLQAEPSNKTLSNKKQEVSKQDVASSKTKATVKVAKTTKQDTDIKVIDALVAQKTENPHDRDIKVLAALVSANSPQASSDTDTAKSIDKKSTSNSKQQTKANVVATNPMQPMTLGNAGETIADKLAKCSELNFIEAPICRVKTCFGHIGSVPECTPELKKQEINTDSTSVISGH
jgi:hypothetical protein